MYEQFKELADVDITTGPMEVGPTTHYAMGGIRVDADTGATTVPGLFAAGEVAGGMHGANRLGGNSLSDLLVFGARTGAAAAAHAAATPDVPYVDPVQVQAAVAELAAPLERTEGEDPYAIQRDLQETMQRLVGIFRIEADLDEALGQLAELRRRWTHRPGHRRPRLQPGLEPRLRARQPADRLRGDRPQRPTADRESRRPQPARSPGHGRDDLGWPQQRRLARPGRHDARRHHRTPRDDRRAAQPARSRRPLTEEERMPDAHLRVFRGAPDEEARFDEFDVPVEEGMVVLDALHWIQGHEAPDLAVRWNCKAAKCGSCSAEVDGRPSLTCKTRLSDFDLDQPITVEPMRAFPLIRDLVTDVSWNYEVNKTIEPFTPPADVPQEDWRWQQEDIERVQEYRKCIECFLCQDVCHVLRNHETEQPFMGPRYLVRVAGLEMHPIDEADRRGYLKDAGGIGYCNITKCCTEVCPEHIKITDNAIIPLKERVADAYYDPIQWVWRRIRGDGSDAAADEPSCRSSRARHRRTRSPVERPALPGSRDRRRPGAAAGRPETRLRHPDRRRGAGQPRARLARRGAVRPRPTRRT